MHDGSCRYLLVERLCHIDASVLLTTLPMVAQQLSPETDEADRKQAVALFGNMFVSQGNALMLHAGIWRLFIDAGGDASPVIRLKIIDFIHALFAHHDQANVDADLTQALESLIIDCDATVRAHAVRVSHHHVMPISMPFLFMSRTFGSMCFKGTSSLTLVCALCTVVSF